MIIQKTILCIADAPGPAEFLAPVIPLLAKHAHVIVVAVGTAMKILHPFGAVMCNDESVVDELFNTIKPNILVSAISSLTHGPYVNNKFIKRAHGNGIPIISLQDIWGNHRCLQNKEIIPFVTGVCVLDEFSALLWKNDRFDGKIFITGNPAFDRFAALDVAKERNRLRMQLHIKDNDRVILYAGQGTPHHIEADKKTFSYVSEAIRGFNSQTPIKLIARRHPRAIETAYYTQYSHSIKMIDTSLFEFSDEILPAVDIVVSMCSTNLLHACYLRIPAVSVLLPEAGKALLEQIMLDDFPPNITGASVGVYDTNSTVLTETFEKIFTDNSFCSRMRECQEKNFPFTINAAKHVAEAVESFF